MSKLKNVFEKKIENSGPGCATKVDRIPDSVLWNDEYRDKHAKDPVTEAIETVADIEKLLGGK